jgi:D-galactarolactone cycloisomerase
VKVTADDGHVGWGEAQVPVGPEVARACVETRLAALVLGEDPLDTEAPEALTAAAVETRRAAAGGACPVRRLCRGPVASGGP